MPMLDACIPGGVRAFTFEVPGKTWGGLGGRVLSLPGMAGRAAGDAGRRDGEQRLAGRRRKQARMLFGAARREASA
jgi:microcystin-dependent protein